MQGQSEGSVFGGCKTILLTKGRGLGTVWVWSEQAIFPLCLLYDTAFRFGLTINFFFNLQRCAVYVNN